MRIKLSFLFILIAIMFIGCDKEDDRAYSTHIGCWKLAAKWYNFRWQTAEHLHDGGVLVLRPDGQYYNTICHLWTQEPQIGIYKAYGDSIVYYGLMNQNQAAYSCKFVSEANDTLTVRFFQFSKNRILDVKCVAAVDYYNFEDIKERIRNPEIYYNNN